MSDAAMLNAVERRLRAVFGDPAGAFVGVQPDGQPPPSAGQWYVGIDDDGSRSADDNPLSLDEEFGLLVVVTAKLAAAPADRRGARLRIDGELRERARRVATALHGDYTWLADANAEIGASANGFVEPLKLRSVSRVLAKGAAWAWAEAARDPPTVFAREVRFAGARRVQTIEGMT